MHAESIVTRFVDSALSPIHGGRRRVLTAVLWAAMGGSVVSLSRLARGIVGRGAAAKSALARVDRLIGHVRFEREVGVVAQALLVRWLDPLVIAADWSAVTPVGRSWGCARRWCGWGWAAG